MKHGSAAVTSKSSDHNPKGTAERQSLLGSADIEQDFAIALQRLLAEGNGYTYSRAANEKPNEPFATFAKKRLTIPKKSFIILFAKASNY